MDENEFIEEGNTIGQCYLCKCKIRKTSAWHSQSTVNWAGKKICGACLYGLVKPVARAEKLYLKENIYYTGKNEAGDEYVMFRNSYWKEGAKKPYFRMMKRVEKGSVTSSVED